MSPVALDDVIHGKGRVRRLVLGFGALLILALLFAAVVSNAFHAARQQRETERWHVHSLEVLLTVEAIEAGANEAMRGERGYLITSDARFLTTYDKARREVPLLVTELKAQVSDNAAQLARIVPLELQANALFRLLDETIVLHREGRNQDVTAIVRRGIGRPEITGMLAQLGLIEAEERQLLAVRAQANAQAMSMTERYDVMLAGAGLVLLMIAAAAGVSTMRAQRQAREIAEQLRRTAATDELTGLANRRAFLNALEVELARAKRSGAPLSVAVADVDHFKRVNDRHGHGGGDEVLRMLARTAEATMRTGDVVGRLGGEEFAILMPDTDEDAARIACERLRRAVAARRIVLPGGEDVAITLSTGIALLVPGEDRDRFVSRADHALYRAKEGGRNQVRLAA